MARKFIDFVVAIGRDCNRAVHFAGILAAVVEAAAQHAVAVHKHADSPDLRTTLRSAVKEGSPA